MKQPCKECPFKKSSSPGYLGALNYDPEAFLDQIEHQPNTCHLSVEGNIGVNTDTKVRHCVGHLQFLCNTFKLPRDREWAKLRNETGKNEDVFATKQEFIKHHDL